MHDLSEKGQSVSLSLQNELLLDDGFNHLGLELSLIDVRKQDAVLQHAGSELSVRYGAVVTRDYIVGFPGGL